MGKILMNFRKMQYFIDVVRLESITKAAEKNHIAQCAMSQQIKSIEETVDALLLIRQRNHITATKAGIIFYTFCMGCLERHDITMKKIQGISNADVSDNA